MFIKKISTHARNEKNLRKGHPWNLHIWWARRPWGACRAVILSSLLPAPTDKNCPSSFIKSTNEILTHTPFKPKDLSPKEIESSLLSFIAEYAKWELGSDSVFNKTARELIAAAKLTENKPIIFDSFSGYGAIPGEAARLGCDSIAMDLNPVSNICMRVLLYAVANFGQQIIDKYEDGVEYIKEEAKKRLSQYYPTYDDKDAIAWLWARTVTCEGPGCGVEIPLISQTLIAKGKRKTWIEISGDKKNKKVNIQIKTGTFAPKQLLNTAGGGHAICPVCGYTTNKERVKIQGKEGKIGNRILGVAIAIGTRQGKEYKNITEIDIKAYKTAELEWERIVSEQNQIDITEPFPVFDPRAFTAGLYGIKTWGDLFSPRQKLALYTIGKIIKEYGKKLEAKNVSDELVRYTLASLSLAVSNTIHYQTNMSTWLAEHMISCFITGNAIAMRWDWAEANPLCSEYVGGLDFSFKNGLGALYSVLSINNQSITVRKANATELPLPDDSADLFFTDPPYYDVVPYADLSDLNFVWLKRYIGNLFPDLFNIKLTTKSEQIVVNPYAVADERGKQSHEYYQERMTKAFKEGHRVLREDGIGAIVFAHKGTAAWETLLSSVIDAGFVVTASWPIDTERAARMRANKSSALSSSIHLIVRPRKMFGEIEIGDLRDVLVELPKRIHEWMPRLSEEGIVGADAIFACLGPALEIFSRYLKVEKASGDIVTLKEYLEQVWAAVAKEALTMIFAGADTTGFEEDSRLTAMWLWTLKTADTNGNDISSEDEGKKGKVSGGFALEYDAARKIAQGLGAHLENLKHLVLIKGDTAILIPVAARTKHLFGKDTESTKVSKRKKQEPTLFDFDESFIEQESESWKGDIQGQAGETVLDQLHQCMLLFAANRSEALKRFLIEEGIGNNPLFWRLAQSLSALYPGGTDEKRWVDGLLAKKKGFGF
ncbi:MAG: DUF1156 domain-containing protein [Candidatus Atribacteria bacterium]|nr:DUF1156 domain-containing protein [Candidatus Atribacteria bacterium]